MNTIISMIMSIIIPLAMQFAAFGGMATEPEDSARDFLDGFKSCDTQVILRYADTDQVNMIESVDEDKLKKQIYEDIFANFDYEIEGSLQRNSLAVVKVRLVTDDFSKADDMYHKDAVRYITSNIYSESVTDKEKLKEKCLKIYAGEIDKISQKSEPEETTVYLPMKSNSYYGWDIMADENLMKSIFGGLETIEIKK